MDRGEEGPQDRPTPRTVRANRKSEARTEGTMDRGEEGPQDRPTPRTSAHPQRVIFFQVPPRNFRAMTMLAPMP